MNLGEQARQGLLPQQQGLGSPLGGAFGRIESAPAEKSEMDVVRQKIRDRHNKLIGMKDQSLILMNLMAWLETYGESFGGKK